jgi:ABC-2 type transport system permease protein
VSTPVATPAAQPDGAAQASGTEPSGANGPLEPRQLGHRIKGPSALGSDPRRLLHLTWALAKTEFKLAFFGSVLGYLWQLMRPLLLFGVIYLVISHSKLADSSEPFYPASLLLGIVLFTFFSESSGGAVSSLVNRESLVRKVEFPRLAVPLSIVVTALLNLALNLVPVLIFLLAAGGSPQWSWLELPLLLAALACLTAGLGMILSVSYVSYRDVRPIWEVVLQMTFYASGIFIAIAGLKPVTVFGQSIDLGHVLMANPFAAILQQARHVFISHSYPSAANAIGGGALVLIPIGIALAAIVGGFVLFDRRAPRVAEQL